jgi:hypothetical protein
MNLLRSDVASGCRKLPATTTTAGSSMLSKQVNEFANGRLASLVVGERERSLST